MLTRADNFYLIGVSDPMLRLRHEIYMTFSDESNDGISYLLVFCLNDAVSLTKCTERMV